MARQCSPSPATDASFGARQADRRDCVPMDRDHTLFRPRRRPWLRFTLLVGACVLMATGAFAVTWLRLYVVPPDCAAADTLAQVRRSLVERFKLPAHLRIENIQTRAGGYLAFRFACEADLRG